MGQIKSPKLSGWRKAATVNTAVLACVSIILLGLLLTSSIHAGGIVTTFTFYRGTCNGGTASRVNQGLHLIINAFATCILASSNFFMQVLNAPSRDEVDAAHRRGQSLHIGVQSWRNATRVARSKTCAWAVLVLTSIPIHLFFNSAVFDTDWRESDYSMVIASEDFVSGADYYPPGATLLFTGGYSGYGTAGFGDFNATIARDAAVNGASWTVLERQACIDYYVSCYGLSTFGNMILVVSKENRSWARDGLWDIRLANISANWTATGVPSDGDNSLWMATECYMAASGQHPLENICDSNCFKALGATFEEDDGQDDGTLLSTPEDWTIDFFPGQICAEDMEGYHGCIDLDNTTRLAEAYGVVPHADVLEPLAVEYCLAQKLDQQCGVGLSNQILLAVVLCVLVKTATCAVVLLLTFKEASQPLVTVGDAIESFIVSPDQSTCGLGLAEDPDIKGTQRLQTGHLVTVAVRWRSITHRGTSAIPLRLWLLDSVPLGLALICIIVFISVMHGKVGAISFLASTDSSHNTDFGTNYTKLTFGIIMAANSPQLVLSLWYLAYNTVLTRLVLAREWGRFATQFRPLRVTSPKGCQISTYFLSLPFRYSIPMIILSTLLHWILSNSIYVFVGEGGYFTENMHEIRPSDPILPSEDAVLAFRFNNASLILVLGLAIAMFAALVALSHRRISMGHMPLVGTDSRAISAACHISPLSKADVDENDCSIGCQDENGGSEVELNGLDSAVENQGLMESEVEAKGESEIAAVRVKVSRGLLKWGIVRMPQEWYHASDDLEENAVPSETQLAHMSFGTKLDNVETPKEGNWYIFL